MREGERGKASHTQRTIRTERFSLSPLSLANMMWTKVAAEEFPCIVGSPARLPNDDFDVAKLFLNDTKPCHHLSEQRLSRRFGDWTLLWRPAALRRLADREARLATPTRRTCP